MAFDYQALEDKMREQWPETIAPMFRKKERWIPEKAPQKTSLQVQLFGLLAKPMTLRDMMTKTGSARNTIAYNLKIMERRGLVCSTGRGTKARPLVWQRVKSRTAT